MRLKQSATSGANGDNMLSQTSKFGDYIVGSPNWVKPGSLDANMIYLGGFAVIALGVLVWKFKK